MSRIESEVAAVFYAEYVRPLSMANARARVSYLDPVAPGGWASVSTRTGGYAHVDTRRMDVGSLLEDLGAYWRAQGALRLLPLLPGLVALQRGLAETAKAPSEASEPVIDYMYPMV